MSNEIKDLAHVSEPVYVTLALCRTRSQRWLGPGKSLEQALHASHPLAQLAHLGPNVAHVRPQAADLAGQSPIDGNDLLSQSCNLLTETSHLLPHLLPGLPISCPISCRRLPMMAMSSWLRPSTCFSRIGNATVAQAIRNRCTSNSGIRCGQKPQSSRAIAHATSPRVLGSMGLLGVGLERANEPCNIPGDGTFEPHRPAQDRMLKAQLTRMQRLPRKSPDSCD